MKKFELDYKRQQDKKDTTIETTLICSRKLGLLQIEMLQIRGLFKLGITTFKSGRLLTNQDHR